MAIVEHSQVEHAVRAPWAYEKCQVVECDFCHRQAHKVGKDAGEAAESARAMTYFSCRRGRNAIWARRVRRPGGRRRPRMEFSG